MCLAKWNGLFLVCSAVHGTNSPWVMDWWILPLLANGKSSSNLTLWTFPLITLSVGPCGSYVLTSAPIKQQREKRESRVGIPFLWLTNLGINNNSFASYLLAGTRNHNFIRARGSYKTVSSSCGCRRRQRCANKQRYREWVGCGWRLDEKGIKTGPISFCPPAGVILLPKALLFLLLPSLLQVNPSSVREEKALWKCCSAHTSCNDRLALILTGTWKRKKKGFPDSQKNRRPPLFFWCTFSL